MYRSTSRSRTSAPSNVTLRRSRHSGVRGAVDGCGAVAGRDAGQTRWSVGGVLVARVSLPARSFVVALLRGCILRVARPRARRRLRRPRRWRDQAGRSVYAAQSASGPRSTMKSRSHRSRWQRLSMRSASSSIAPFRCHDLSAHHLHHWCKRPAAGHDHGDERGVQPHVRYLRGLDGDDRWARGRRGARRWGLRCGGLNRRRVQG